MFTAAELAEHRADAESMFRNTFAAFAPGPLAGDPGKKKPGWIPKGTTLGKTQAGGRQSTDAATRQVNIGGVEYDVLESGLHIPLAAYVVDGVLELRIGWEFQCTAIGEGVDLAQLGRRWHVVEVPTKSYPTARRLDVAEVPALDLS